MKKAFMVFCIVLVIDIVASVIGYATIVIVEYVSLDKDSCVSFKSNIIGDYKKESCDKEK